VKKNLNLAKLASNKIPQNLEKDVSIKSVIAQIQLLEKTLSVSGSAELKAKLLASPKNISIKFEYALALIAEDDTRNAINTLLQIIEKDPDWNGGKAKSQFIELLDALGPDSDDGRAGRRKLSSLIFS
jgi:putative thioredoxin